MKVGKNTRFFSMFCFALLLLIGCNSQPIRILSEKVLVPPPTFPESHKILRQDRKTLGTWPTRSDVETHKIGLEKEELEIWDERLRTVFNKQVLDNLKNENVHKMSGWEVEGQTLYMNWKYKGNTIYLKSRDHMVYIYIELDEARRKLSAKLAKGNYPENWVPIFKLFDNILNSKNLFGGLLYKHKHGKDEFFYYGHGGSSTGNHLWGCVRGRL